MKKVYFLIVLIFFSCSSQLKTRISDAPTKKKNTENYVTFDIDTPKFETVLIDHYRTINPNPLVINGQLLFTTKNGRFHSYDLKKNKLLEKESYCFGTNLSPLVHKDRLYLFSSVGKESVQAFDEGDKTWAKDIPYGIESMPVLDESGVYIASANGKVYKFNHKTGETLWEIQLKKPIHSDLIMMFDLLIISDDSGRLQSLDKQTGNVVWELNLNEGASYTKPILLGAKLIFTTIDGYIAEINPLLGKIVWERHIGAPIYSTPSSDGKNIYFGSNDGHVYKLNRDGKIIKKFDTKSNVNAQILVGAKNIYFGTGNGIFYSLLKDNFDIVWKREFKGRFISSPFFWEENLIVYSDNDDVYMFSNEAPKSD